MSNQFQGIASGLAELKNRYIGPMKDQFNEELPIWRGAEKVKEGWNGYQVVRPLRVLRNQGIGATTDGGPLPAIGRQGTAQALISSKFNYLRFGVTGPMIKAAASDQGSFVRTATYELEMGYKDLKSDINRQLSWDGGGQIALVNANTAGSTSLVIKGRESTAAALQFVDIGLTFDIYSGSTQVAQGITVNAVSGTPTGATATLTLNAPVTCSANDKIVRSGSFGNEIQGLLYALDGGTSTIYNIDRSQYLQFQGNVTDMSSAQLTLNAMQGAWNAGLQRGGANYGQTGYLDFTSLQYYQKLLTPDKRYINTVKGDGGFSDMNKTYLEFNGCALVADKDCPTRIFFLDREAIKNYVLAELEFADETGSMMISQTGSDQFEVRVRLFSNLFNEQPSACSVIKSYLSP